MFMSKIECNGSTVPLGNGNADFESTFNELNKIHYKEDFILQLLGLKIIIIQ